MSEVNQAEDAQMEEEEMPFKPYSISTLMLVKSA
jgi:signal recognition particle subunit SRP68